MYYLEPVLAFVCLSSTLTLFIAWRVLRGSDDSSSSSKPFLKQALTSTGNYIIPAEIRDSYLEEEQMRVHEFRDVYCSYHGADDFEVQWSETDDL